MLGNRRTFIRNATLAGTSLLLSRNAWAEEENNKRRLTILHTNDVHSRLDPFTDGSFKGKGGVAARAKLISGIRAAEENVLLLDAGDMFQGTPYFNFYKGEPEVRAMSMMGYDAGTIGNHDFDGGIENLANQIAAHARFPLINCNYDFSGTPMENHHRPYHILKKGDVKIGITGVGIRLEGLVADGLYGTTKYNDPVQAADQMVAFLRHDKKCDLVILLSHLGDKYEDDQISDEKLAERTSGIDLIIGGHTHRFFDKPRVYKGIDGRQVVVNQVGWAGIKLGRIDYIFGEKGEKKFNSSDVIVHVKK